MATCLTIKLNVGRYKKAAGIEAKLAFDTDGNTEGTAEQTGGLRHPLAFMARLSYAIAGSRSSLASRRRATCRRRLIVPTGEAKLSLISTSDSPRR